MIAPATLPCSALSMVARRDLHQIFGGNHAGRGGRVPALDTGLLTGHDETLEIEHVLGQRDVQRRDGRRDHGRLRAESDRPEHSRAR